VDYRYHKDAADTLDLTVQLRQGTTVIASLVHTNIAAAPTAGTFSLTEAQVGAITDYTNIRLRFIANKTAGGGSTRARVTWAQFKTGGKRDPVAYLNQSLKDVYDDLLVNQLGIEESLIGPSVEDDTTLVSKTITVTGGTKPTSKRELDAIAHLGGGGVISSQGRILFRELYGVRPIRAVFPSTEIKMEAAGPGYEQRVPIYFVKWRWNETTQVYEDELRVLHAGAFTKLGKARINATQTLDEDVAQWIQTEALASAVGNRHVAALGPGLLEWRFTAIYPYPELEPGDLILVETDQFLARDPNASRALRGVLWAAGVVRSVDVSARKFTIWIRNYADILGATEAAKRLRKPIPEAGDFLVNGNFESGFFGWAADPNQGFGTSQLTQLESVDVYAGDFSLKLTQIAAPVGAFLRQGVFMDEDTFVPVTPGKTIEMRGVAKCPASGSPGATFDATFYTADKVQVGSVTGLTWTATSYTELRSVILVPATARFVVFSLFATSSGNNVFLFDELHAHYVESSNVSADRGDANVTLVAGVDEPTQRFATTLTANRTVTLGAGYKGAWFRVARTGLGAFTLDVGGLKTIPNSTAAFVDVDHDGTAWRLTAYGTL